MESSEQYQPQQKVPGSSTTHTAYDITSSTTLDQQNQQPLSNHGDHKNPRYSQDVNDTHYYFEQDIQYREALSYHGGHRNPTYSQGVNDTHYYVEQDIQYNDHPNPNSFQGVNNVYFQNLRDFQCQTAFAALQNDDQNNPSSSSEGSNGNQVYPPGYRFCPRDCELINYYLKRKMENPQLSWDHINEVDLYQHDPDELTAGYPKQDQPEWYFFTPRNKKYPHGTRPNRATNNGFWKATGADRNIVHEGKIIGKNKPLVFYRGNSRSSQGNIKTNWIMHEYRVHDSITSRRKRSETDNDMRLDDYVLCKISKTGRSNKSYEHEESTGDQETSRIGSSNINNLSGSNSYNVISPLSDGNGNVQAMDVADGIVAGISNFQQAHLDPMVNPVNYNMLNQVDVNPIQMHDNFAQVDPRPTAMEDNYWDMEDNMWHMAAHQDFVWDFESTGYGFASPKFDDYVMVRNFPSNDNFSASRFIDPSASCADKVADSSMDPSATKKN